MECAINSLIRKLLIQRSSPDSIAKQVLAKFGIHMDSSAISARIKAMKMGYSLEH